MSNRVFIVIQIEHLATNLEVGRLEYANVKWLPAENEHPLPEIKLMRLQVMRVQQQRVLNVLLNNLLLGSFVGNDLGKLTGTVDSHASGRVARLDNPQVVDSVYGGELGQDFSKLEVNFDNFELFVG